MQHVYTEERQEAALETVRHDDFITPFPWTVESHPDTEGGYIIREARNEQQTWCDQGYESPMTRATGVVWWWHGMKPATSDCSRLPQPCLSPCGIWRFLPVQPLRLAPCWKPSFPIGSN